MTRWLLLFGVIFSCASVLAQKVKTVSAEYTYYAPENMSIEEAKRTALDRAKLQAIADEFGTIVSQNTSTVVSTKNGKSDTQFFAIGGSDVKGEWIETIGEPKFNFSFTEHLLVVTCKVKGKARQITSPKIDFIAKPLRNGTDLRFESYDFKEGDELFLYFKSPVDGYLTVFLLDETTQTVYCALPYRNSDGNSRRIEADKEYVLFSKNHSDRDEKYFVDEYIMTATNEMEYNDLYVIFSPKPFAKTTLENSTDTLLPKITNLHDFQKWFVKSCLQAPDISLLKIVILINK